MRARLGQEKAQLWLRPEALRKDDRVIKEHEDKLI